MPANNQAGTYTLKDPDSGRTFDFKLDHRPNMAESIQLINSELAQEAANRITARDKVISPPSKTSRFIHGVGQFGEGLGSGLLQSMRSALSNEQWTPPGQSNVPKGLQPPSYFQELGNLLHIYGKGGLPALGRAIKPVMTPYNTGRLIGGSVPPIGGVAEGPFEGTIEPPAPKETPQGPTIDANVVSGRLPQAAVPKQLPAATDEIAGGMEESNKGIEGQIGIQKLPEKSLLGNKPAIKAPGEIGTPRKIVAPSQAAFGAMPESSIPVPKQLPSGERPALQGAPEQLQLQSNEPKQIPEKTGRPNLNPTRSDAAIKKIIAPQDARIVLQLSKNPANRDLLALSIGRFKNQGLNPEEITKIVPHAVDKVALQTELQKQFGDIIQSPEQTTKGEETGFTVRTIKNKVKSLKQAMASKGISFGSLADEPEGEIMPSGFGALQKLFDKKDTLQPEVPRNKPSALQAYFGSVSKSLRKDPINEHLGKELDWNAVNENRYVNSALKLVDNILDAPEKQKQDAWDLLQQYNIPTSAIGRYDIDTIHTAQRMRDLLETLRTNAQKRYAAAGIPLPQGKGEYIGYWNNYTPRIKEIQGDWPVLERVLQSRGSFRQFGRNIKRLISREDEPSLYSHSILPVAQQELEREGKNEGWERDPNKVLPIVVESMSRIAFRKPMYYKLWKQLHTQKMSATSRGLLEAAMAQLKEPPLGYQELSKALNQLSSDINNLLTGTKLFGSIRLQELHWGAVVNMGVPMFGPLNVAKSINYFRQHMGEVYTRVMKYQHPSMVMPWRLRSGPDKLRQVGMFANMGFISGQAVLYHAALNAAKEEGLTGDQAESEAFVKLQNVFGIRQAGRHAPFIHFLMSNWLGKFITRYKTTPYYQAENYVEALQNILRDKKDWKSFKQTIGFAMMAGTTLYLLKKYGIPFFHFTWNQLSFTSAMEGLGYVWKAIKADDIDAAAKEFVRFIEPSSARAVQKYGPVKGTFLDEYGKSKDNTGTMPREFREEMGIPSQNPSDEVY